MVWRNVFAGLGVLVVVAISAVTISAYGGRSWDDAPPRLSVSFRGLDLTSAEGVALLDERVRVAVNRVCSAHAALERTRPFALQKCRDQAFASAQPQIERAIAKASANGGREAEPTIFAELDRQPRGIRKSVRRAIFRTLLGGRTANWYSWGAKGLVYAQDRIVDGEGRSCGLVTVTAKSRGVQEVIAAGPACASIDGRLSAG